MTNKELIRNIMFSQGKADALNLRIRAADLSGTEIIAEEEKIPMFDPNKDYSAWTAGVPVYDILDGEKQVFTLITPHNASHYPGVRPNNNRTLWNLTHTKDAAKAKAFVAPSGTSGLYMLDEVCAVYNEDGERLVYRSKADNNPYSPTEYAANWTLVTE